MKVDRYFFGAWSSGDRSFRTDLAVYDLRGCDPLEAEKALEGNGEERICVHSIGGCLMVTFSLCCWTLRSTAEEVKGEEYLLTRKSFEDFLESLEDWEVLASHEDYPARFRYKETVEI